METDSLGVRQETGGGRWCSGNSEDMHTSWGSGFVGNTVWCHWVALKRCIESYWGVLHKAGCRWYVFLSRLFSLPSSLPLSQYTWKSLAHNTMNTRFFFSPQPVATCVQRALCVHLTSPPLFDAPHPIRQKGFLWFFHSTRGGRKRTSKRKGKQQVNGTTKRRT